MSLKRFEPQDLIYNTLVAKPSYNFTIHSGSVYKNDEVLTDGDFSNKIKHVSDGDVSLHELNVNRPADSLVYGFIEKGTTRYAYRTISTSQFDDASQFQYGNVLTQSYPAKASISRIYVKSGPEIDDRTFANIETPTAAASNKKYIRALKNVINSRELLGQSFTYNDLGTKEVNLICIPGIFYGSKIDKGSIELNHYITGTLAAQLKDTNNDGVLYESVGPQSGSIAGMALYEQGIMVLTGSWSLGTGYTDQFFSAASVAPSWLSFGTGISTVGTAVDSRSVVASSYAVNFKGTNKIPTLTMMAFAEKGEHNFSNNPSFLELKSTTATTGSQSYSQSGRKIKNIVKSPYTHQSASFHNITYISKVGIYDENKNLIAIATLANPVKKTPNRDYLIKMRLDF